MKSLTRGRALALGVAYVLLHIGLDAAARWFEVADGVSLWYPPVGLGMALVMILGPRWVPVFFGANLLAAWLGSSWEYDWVHVFMPLCVASIYSLAGLAGRRWFGPTPTPNKAYETAGLVALMLVTPCVAAAVGTLFAIVGHGMALAQFPEIAFGWWIGDLTGVLTTLPLCLVHLGPRLLGSPPPRQRWSRRAWVNVAGQVALLAGCLFVMHGFGSTLAYRAYYVCFAPLVWICLAHGLPGATLAIFFLTLGSLATLRLTGASPAVATDLFLFEIASSSVGLGLGATVTRRSRAENERSRLLAILEATPDFIATVDLDGRLLYQNAAFLRLCGPATPPRDRLADRLPSWAADRLAQDGYPTALARGLWQGELALLGGDGRELPVAQTIVAHHGSDGRPLMLSTVARDITTEREAERSRLETERNLLQTQKLESLGVLAGGIAHDFNNLLTVVLGNATLARLDTPADSSAEKAIHQIELAALRAADLCRQMLAYSGRGQLGTEVLDLTQIVDETAGLLRVSISKKCTLEFDLATDLPPVRGDATQLNQITMNLVMNASDASGEHGGRILVRTGLMHADRAYLDRTYLAPALEPGPFVFLEVSDEGVGMTPEVKARIFEPFFTTKFTGHGLGLSAVLGIARSHRGAVRVDSTPGAGSTFRLLLPVAGGAPAPAAAEASAPAGWRTTGRVLIIDDEDPVREIAAKILERCGLDAVHAENGRVGVDLFAREPHGYRAILLDLTMPVMDGHQAFREIHRTNPRVPVLLMSGYSRSDSATRFAGLKVAGFVQKPFNTARLTEAVRTALAHGLH